MEGYCPVDTDSTYGVDCKASASSELVGIVPSSRRQSLRISGASFSFNCFCGLVNVVVCFGRCRGGLGFISIDRFR